MATEVPEDVARRFRAVCAADDRSVSCGLRRLVREYLAEIDSPAVLDEALAEAKA